MNPQKRKKLFRIQAALANEKPTEEIKEIFNEIIQNAQEEKIKLEQNLETVVEEEVKTTSRKRKSV